MKPCNYVIDSLFLPLSHIPISGELDSYLSHCSEFPSLGGSSSGARPETGLRSVNMEPVNTSHTANLPEKRKIDSDSDSGYINSPSKMVKIESQDPHSPAALGSGLARRNIGSDNINMMSGGSVKLEVKSDLDDPGRLMGMKSGGLSFPIGSGPEESFLLDPPSVTTEQMMTPVDQKDKQKTNTAAKIRVALEASGLAGNLTPEDLQTLKRLNEIAKSTGLSQDAKSMEASQLLKNNPNVSRLLLKLRTEKNIISKPGLGQGPGPGPGPGPGVGLGSGQGQGPGQGGGPGDGGVQPPSYSSSNYGWGGQPAQWSGQGYYRPGLVQPGHMADMGHMGTRLHPDHSHPANFGAGSMGGRGHHGVMMDRLGSVPPKTMYVNRQTGLLMPDYPPGPGMMGPRPGGYPGGPGGVPPPYINPGGFHPGHPGHHANIRRMMMPGHGPSGPYDPLTSGHRTNMYPMVHNEFDNSFPSAPANTFRDFRDNMGMGGPGYSPVRPQPPHSGSQLRDRLTSSSQSLAGGSELANRLIHGKPQQEPAPPPQPPSYDYNVNTFTNGNNSLRTESEALFEEIDNSQFDYFNSLDTNQDQSSQNYNNLENNDSAIADQFFDTWKSSSNTSEVRNTMLRKLSMAIESNQEISGGDASKLASEIESKAFGLASSETTYMHSIAQHLAKIFSQSKVRQQVEESPDSTSWQDQTCGPANSSPDSSQTPAKTESSHFPSDTTRHCFQVSPILLGLIITKC